MFYFFRSFQTTDNNVRDRSHGKTCTELKRQNADAQKDKTPGQQSIGMNNAAVTTYLPLETVIYVTSKQVNTVPHLIIKINVPMVEIIRKYD